ncbi:MAG: peptidoglycan DD-metalloendopeptidase family protein [Marmoricola sp.]
MSFPKLSRTTSGVIALGLLATPAVVAMSNNGLDLVSAHRTVPLEQRTSTAPNVFFPVISKYAKDLKTFGKRPGTEIQAPCGAVVRAATAGTALVSASRSSGPNLVRVVTSKGKLVSYYGYMNRATVTSGQVVAAGQQIGNVGNQGIAKRCSLYFAMTNGLSGIIKLNPSTWLNNYVGKQLPQTSLFDNDGFVLASFNTLGAVHTPNARYPGYATRTPKQVTLLNGYNADVIGLQEFEPKQKDAFLASANGTFGIFPEPNTTRTDNSLIWRSSTFELVSGTTMGIPYFEGRTAQVPVVLLRQKSTGRTAYFINVHNPASIAKYGDQSKWRAKAIAIERAKIIELRKTGLPVFVTGDFNDRQNAFCPLTAGKLMISANSIPSMTCALPSTLWIDWVFAAGPARFTSWVKDNKPRDLRISDHPIIVTRAYMAPPS